MRDGQPFIVHANKLPHPTLSADKVARFRIENGVSFNHLLQDVFEFVIGGEGRGSGCFLQKRFNQFTADVFLFLRQLWLKTKPKGGTATVFVGRWLVNVNKNWLAGDIDKIQWSLLFGISVKRTIVNRARPVTHFEISNPISNVRICSHDAVEVALGKTWFVAHDTSLLSSPP